MPVPVGCRGSSEGAGPGSMRRGRSQAGPGGSRRSTGSMAEADRDGVSGSADPPRYRGALHPDTWEQVRRRDRARGRAGRAQGALCVSVCPSAGAGGHPHVHEALPGRDRRGPAARARLPAVAAVRRGAQPRRCAPGRAGARGVPVPPPDPAASPQSWPRCTRTKGTSTSRRRTTGERWPPTRRGCGGGAGTRSWTRCCSRTAGLHISTWVRGL